jgi:hypothetical protein
MIEQRARYIIKLDWIKQFQLYPQKEETQISKWDHHFCYPKLRYLPKTTADYQVEKGMVYLTEGVNKKDFNIKP